MTERQIPPLPSEADYLRETLDLDLIFNTNGGVQTYMGNYFQREYNRSMAMRAFEQQMTRFGLIIEPMDRTTHELFDSERKVTADVVKGGVTGLVLLGKTHGRMAPTSQVLDHISIGNPGNVDDDAGKDLIARQLMAKGWEGIRRLGSDAAEIIERWEDQMAVSRDPHMFRVGLGITAICAITMHSKALAEVEGEELARFRALVEGDHQTDWDQELAMLLGPEGSTTDPSQ